jgi:hypothetical protein
MKKLKIVLTKGLLSGCKLRDCLAVGEKGNPDFNN